MISVNDLSALLNEIPANGILRIAANGSSVYIARNGIEITSKITEDTFLVKGLIGETRDQLAVGSAIIRGDRVDLIQVIL